MAYFLKKTNNKKGTYLQIYESFWDPDRRQTAHRSVKPIGYVHELQAQGTDDPVAHWRAEVERMNAERRQERQLDKVRRIGDSTPERHLGHFAAAGVWRGLGVAGDLSLLQLQSGFRFSLAELLEGLACARLVHPCSKTRTFHDVLPLMGGTPAFSQDQMYDGIAFLGHEYKKVVEIMNQGVAGRLGRDTSVSFFDCTNFYFEIDREDDLRKKGPSKERRTDPIVGMGLLLDASCLPIGLEVYPGNESEKPKLKKVISELKERSHIKGRTVRVADKGLNCADNVTAAVLDGDGYLFSKSVKTLPATELAWVLSEEGWSDHLGPDGKVHHRTKSAKGDFSYAVTGADGKKTRVSLPERRVVTFSESLRRKQTREINRQVEKARRLRLAQAKRSEYGDSAKYVTFVAVDGEGEVSDEAVVATLNHKAIDRARKLAGYNMLVTSETAMGEADVYATYHRLWRIEESFRVMKTELEARPVFMRTHDSIVGHFLVCYVAVLLMRIVQMRVLRDEFGSPQVMEFMRGCRAVQVSERKYVNVTRDSPVIQRLKSETGLPLDHYYLTKGQYDKILKYRFDLSKYAGQTASAIS